MNLNRFSIIKTPFLSGVLKSATKEALTTKEELKLSILESKKQIKEIKNKIKDMESMAIASYQYAKY